MSKMIGRPILSHIPDIEHLSQRVVRVLGQNPSPMTLQGTNSYIVGTGSKRLLIDTSSPGTQKYGNLLQSTLEKLNSTISTILLTHYHYDHIGMVSQLLNLPNVKGAEVLKMKRKVPDLDAYDFTFDELKVDGQNKFLVEGATLVPIATPGHSDDHVGFQLLEENAIFPGDSILGEGSTTFECLHDYMKSLRLIKDMKPGRLYPAHGPVLENGVEALTNYINHRQAREDQIVEVLKVQKEAIDMETLRAAVYPDIASNETRILQAAANNLILHLGKLVKDGKVIENDGTWRLINNASL